MAVSGFYAYLGSDIGPFSSAVQADPYANYGNWAHISTETGAMVSSPYAIPREHTGGTLPMQPENKGAVTLIYETSLDAIPRTVKLLGTLSFVGDRYPYVHNVNTRLCPLMSGWTCEPAGLALMSNCRQLFMCRT